VKRKLEEVPENAYVLIDASRADFIDQDVVETIEDFMLHAPLKKIRVEIKANTLREHPFRDMIPIDDSGSPYYKKNEGAVKKPSSSSH
jgi:MFS superfamily sulfate permease-like transporter